MLCDEDCRPIRTVFRMISECGIGRKESWCVYRMSKLTSNLLMVLTLTVGPNRNDRERAIIVRKRKKPTQLIWTIVRTIQLVGVEDGVVGDKSENMRYDLQFELQARRRWVSETSYCRAGLLFTIIPYNYQNKTSRDVRYYNNPPHCALCKCRIMLPL